MDDTAHELRIYQAIDATTERIAADWPADAPAVVYGHAVVYQLMRYADAKTGECFPKVETIAARLGANRDTITRTLAALQTVGIVHQKTRGGNGRGSSRWVIRKKYRIFGNSSDGHTGITQSSVGHTDISSVGHTVTNSTSTITSTNPSRSTSPESDAKPQTQKFKYEAVDERFVQALGDLIRDVYNQTFKYQGDIESHYNQIRLLRERGNGNIDGPVDIKRIGVVYSWLRDHDDFLDSEGQHTERLEVP